MDAQPAAPPGAVLLAVAWSFAEVLQGPKDDPISSKSAARFKGMPSLSFSKAEVDILAKKHHFDLIGTFMRGRPIMASTRKVFEVIGFKSGFSIGHLDDKHVLIRFDLEEDFQRCWLRQQWSIQGFIMRISRWTPDFRPDVESPIVPVWIGFEGLQIHLQDKRALLSIAGVVGKPLKLDAAIVNLTRPSVARGCVEFDVSKVLPSKIWIDNGDQGFVHPITYEDPPAYCSQCSKLGHNDGAFSSQTRTEAVQDHVVDEKKNKKVWVVREAKNVEAKLVDDKPGTSKSKVDNNGEKKLELGSQCSSEDLVFLDPEPADDETNAAKELHDDKEDNDQVDNTIEEWIVDGQVDAMHAHANPNLEDEDDNAGFTYQSDHVEGMNVEQLNKEEWQNQLECIQ